VETGYFFQPWSRPCATQATAFPVPHRAELHKAICLLLFLKQELNTKERSQYKNFKRTPKGKGKVSINIQIKKTELLRQRSYSRVAVMWWERRNTEGQS